jgi:predicted DNA-binding transcriptional regulator AlpA
MLSPSRDKRLTSTRDDMRVIRWKDWYESKGFGKDTARRLRLSGKGPRIVHLSARAIGVTVRDDREWTESRIQERA